MIRAFGKELVMALSVLYIGGTGQISLPCVEASLAAGHDVTILNRNKTAVPLSKGVKTLIGDMNDVAYGELGDKHFDVVAQFRLYNPDQMRRDITTFAGKTGQYVFISSASVYEKPVRHYLMTERTKLENRTGNTAATRSPPSNCCATRIGSPTRSFAQPTRCAPTCRSRSATPMRRFGG
jgi:hypothetical protein